MTASTTSRTGAATARERRRGELVAPADGPRLVVRDLAAGYGGERVLQGLSLAVAPGEIVALVGPSGSGKSTALLALAGYLPDVTGEARVGDASLLGGLPRQARDSLASVLPGRSTHAGLTVAENLALWGLRADALHALFPELDGSARVLAGRLPRAARQMLALGRALLSARPVLLLDDLTAGLEPLAAYRLLDVLRRAVAAQHLAVLLADRGSPAVRRLAARTVPVAGAAAWAAAS